MEWRDIIDTSGHRSHNPTSTTSASSPHFVELRQPSLIYSYTAQFSTYIHSKIQHEFSSQVHRSCNDPIKARYINNPTPRPNRSSGTIPVVNDTTMLSISIPSLSNLIPWRDRTPFRIPPVQTHEIDTAQEKHARAVKHMLKLNHANYSLLRFDGAHRNQMPHVCLLCFFESRLSGCRLIVWS